ncbi:MAG: ABC transporter permease subunit [Bacilli bacterium]|jgi:D-methionine transport system permease protein|nr:ABC transporter permease subunit [Bacilli bacterium]
MNGIDLWTITWETMLMTFLSTALSYLVGLPLGVLLSATSKNGIHPRRILNTVLGVIVNFLRSIPCLILIVVLLPVSRAIVGRGTGEWYTMIIPLFFSSFAFVARLVEQSLSDVDAGEVEAVRSLGANDWQLITKVILPEARSSLLMGVAVTLVNVIGYTAFAYNIGAGGLISQIYNFYVGHTPDFLTYGVFWVMIVLVVVLVQVIQEAGLFLAKKLDKRRKIK